MTGPTISSPHPEQHHANIYGTEQGTMQESPQHSRPSSYTIGSNLQNLQSISENNSDLIRNNSNSTNNSSISTHNNIAYKINYITSNTTNKKDHKSIAYLSKNTNKKIIDLLNEINAFNKERKDTPELKINSDVIFENFFQTLNNRSDYNSFLTNNNLHQKLEPLFNALFKEINPKKSFRSKSHCDEILKGAKLKINEDLSIIDDHNFIHYLHGITKNSTAQLKINNFVEANYMSKGSKKFYEKLDDKLFKTNMMYRKVIHESDKKNKNIFHYKKVLRNAKKLSKIDPLYNLKIDGFKDDTKEVLSFLKEKSSIRKNIFNKLKSKKPEEIDLSGMKKKLIAIEYIKAKVDEMQIELQKNGHSPSMKDLYDHLSMDDEFIEKIDALNLEFTKEQEKAAASFQENLSAYQLQTTANQTQHNFVISLDMMSAFDNMNGIQSAINENQQEISEIQSITNFSQNMATQAMWKIIDENQQNSTENLHNSKRKFLFYEILSNTQNIK